MKRIETINSAPDTGTGIYEYDQNNSGGFFEVNQKVTCRVYIEAGSAEEADRIAEGIGLYFDGDGDCPCCGNRWSNAYGEPDYATAADVEAHIVSKQESPSGWGRMDGWVRPGEPFAHIYLKDGRQISFIKD